MAPRKQGSAVQGICTMHFCTIQLIKICTVLSMKQCKEREWVGALYLWLPSFFFLSFILYCGNRSPSLISLVTLIFLNEGSTKNFQNKNVEIVACGVLIMAFEFRVWTTANAWGDHPLLGKKLAGPFVYFPLFWFYFNYFKHYCNEAFIWGLYPLLLYLYLFLFFL